MTHPTKAIYHNLLKDFARMSQGGKDEALYNEEDLKASMDKIEVVDFDQTLEVNGIKVRFRTPNVFGFLGCISAMEHETWLTPLSGLPSFRFPESQFGCGGLSGSLVMPAMV